MVLFAILASALFFAIVVFVAIHLVGKANRPEEAAATPVLHASGIYSIVRRSPRFTIAQCKPSDEIITQYLAGKNEDTKGEALSQGDRDELVAHWRTRLEKNIHEIEAGDNQGVEFYYYDFIGNDPVCKGMVDQGHFVTREELFRFPQTLPPFHIGCQCMLRAYHGSENLRETTKLGMRPFFTNSNLPNLPQWNNFLKLS